MTGMLQSWFDEKLGWDLNAVREHADCGTDLEPVLRWLAYMNEIRRDNLKKLDNLTADIQKPCPLAPYNLLFDLMEKYGMKYDHFLHVEKPTVVSMSFRSALIILGKTTCIISDLDV
jgi:hypothetical protein